jgi:hypothetical protein
MNDDTIKKVFKVYPLAMSIVNNPISLHVSNGLRWRRYAREKPFHLKE